MLLDLPLHRDRVLVAVAVLSAGTALGVAAATKPELAVAAGVGAIFAVVAWRNLPGAFCFFVFMTFFDRGTPFLQGAGVTVVKLLGAVLVLVWLIKVLVGQRRMPLLLRDDPLLAFAAMLFVAWAVASATWAEAKGEALFGSAGSAFRLAQGTLLLFIVFSAFTERRHVWWLLRSFVAGALFAAVIGLLGIYGTSASVNDARLSGGFDDPNELAAVLVPAMVLASFAFVALPGRASRWAYAAAAVVMLYALAQTDSQAGLIAVAVALLLAVVLGGRARPIMAVGVVAFLLAAVSYYSFVTKPVAIQTISSENNVGGRESLWSVATHIVRDHPVAGVGAGNFVIVEPEYAFRDINLPRVDLVVRPELAHNSYLQVLAELGVVGLAVFLSVIGGSLLAALRAARTFAMSGDRELDLLSRGFLVGTIAMLVAYFFATNQYEKQLWLVLGVGPALLAVARSRNRAIQQARSMARPSPEHFRTQRGPRLMLGR